MSFVPQRGNLAACASAKRGHGVDARLGDGVRPAPADTNQIKLIKNSINGV